jgi:tetratricopeptide (TPR) repeat protein
MPEPIEVGASVQLRTVAAARAAAVRGRWAEAAASWRRAVEANPVNGDWWTQLAAACWAGDDVAGALEAYGQALELGAAPTDDPETVFPSSIAYRIACCHARLGDVARATEALERALALGFRDLDRLRTDEHLAPLRAAGVLPEFLGAPGGGQDRPGPGDPGDHRGQGGLARAAAADRDDGWRGDLRLLAREVKRRGWAPFRERSEAGFDAAVAELDRAIPELEDDGVLVGLMRIIARLDDGHASVRFPPGDPRGERCLPLQLSWFEEGLFVIAAGEPHAALVGAELLAVGGQPVGRALAAVDPLISRDNRWWPRHIAPALLRQAPVLRGLGLAPPDGAVSLALRLPGDETSEVRVEPDSPWQAIGSAGVCPPHWRSLPETLGSPLPLYLRNRAALYWFQHLPEHELVYCQCNNLLDDPAEPLAAFWPRLLEAAERQRAGLVLDLRANGGGNTFLTTPLVHGLIASPGINRRGRLFVITGRGTFSAAQNLTTLLARHTEAIFVGEPTGSRPNFTGETAPFRLPWSGLVANVSDLYWQTSWPLDHRAWVPPELYAPPTFAAFRANRDPAMAAVLDCRDHLPGW